MTSNSNSSSSSDWFNVTEFRSLGDPSGRLERNELLVPLSSYPGDFGLGPNPREPKMNSRVSKRIGETLENNPETFHLLNRGITVVAKDIQFDNKSKRVRLTLHEDDEEEENFGILDGGNTNARIKNWRESLDDSSELENTFVNMQVLIPQQNGDDSPGKTVLDLLNDVKEARNTSVQVTEKSLADARKHFELLKDAVSQTPYADRVIWHEGQKGTIDALDLVGLLMIVYPRYTEDSGGDEPHLIYGHKAKSLDAFLRYHHEHPAELEAWIKCLPSLVTLFDKIQVELPTSYEGKFGRINAVKIYDESKYEPGNKRYSKTPFKSKFLESKMKYKYPVGYVYPVFAGFRVLMKVDEDAGDVVWKKNPAVFWKNNGNSILQQFKPHMENAQFDSKKIAQSPTCYQAVRHAVTDLYKDELLKEAGILA